MKYIDLADSVRRGERLLNKLRVITLAADVADDMSDSEKCGLVSLLEELQDDMQGLMDDLLTMKGVKDVDERIRRNGVVLALHDAKQLHNGNGNGNGARAAAPARPAA